MKAGSMEGLIGASVNMELTRTPMRVYKDAERRGDTEVMKRAMGYVTEFQAKAHECSDRAQKELAKELKEEREEQEIRREQALERKEDKEEFVEKIQENNRPDNSETDSVEISEEGKVEFQNHSQAEEPALFLENMEVKMYTSESKPMSIDQNVASVDKKIDITV